MKMKTLCLFASHATQESQHLKVVAGGRGVSISNNVPLDTGRGVTRTKTSVQTGD